MGYQERWDIIGDTLGEGGQGKVFRVLDKSEFNILSDLHPSIQNSIAVLSDSSFSADHRKENFDKFRKAIVKLVRMENPKEQGALKVLHEPKEASHPELAEERIKDEIKAMSEIEHPNLLKILDYGSDSKWFVSQYHPKGTLTKNKALFTDNFVGALRAFKPLVEGVSELHKSHRVHRDIKPDNVFLDSNDNLVLGDFGLIFFADEQRTRYSGTFENVGSRDWMPPWAVHKRLEEVKPSFDVFSLGKLLWAMVSGSILPFWEIDEPEYNLESICAESPYINMANPLLKKCVVRREEGCLPDATVLLEEVNKLLCIIDRSADLIGKDIERFCKVCGIGKYKLTVDHDSGRPAFQKFGISPTMARRFKIFVCEYCGNVQMFTFFPQGKRPPAWLD